jgi:hypothetical protein
LGSIRAGGKLYGTYQRKKEKRTKHGLFPRKRKYDESVEAAPVLTTTSAEIETGILLKQWLNTHDTTWEELESKWRQSVKLRNEDIKKLKNVKDISDQWPKYTGAFGYLLVIYTILLVQDVLTTDCPVFLDYIDQHRF